jgi:hypothetical protein
MLHITSAEGVAAITVGGALGVAVITAATTNRRQREALKHDRELVDLAGLRTLLDEAALALNEGEGARGAVQVAFVEHGRNVPEAILDEAEARGQAMFALRQRLFVRVGQTHALARTFNQAAFALLKTWNAVSSLAGDDSHEALEASRAIIRAARHEFEHGFEEFTRAAVASAGIVAVGGTVEPTAGANTGASTPDTAS